MIQLLTKFSRIAVVVQVAQVIYMGVVFLVRSLGSTSNRSVLSYTEQVIGRNCLVSS